MSEAVKTSGYAEWRGFDSHRLHHLNHSNQCLRDDDLRQLWLQYPPVSSDKAALRQPRRALGKRRFPWAAKPRLRIIPGSPDRAVELAAVEDRCVKNPDDCWLYPKVRDGAYPYFDLRREGHPREQWSARRYAWALANGDIPEEGIIMGGCALKACVNPEHQWLWVPPKQFDLLSGDDSIAEVRP